MIVTPEELTFTEKTFSMILYAAPGTGKTTLALSAPDPVLIDFDHGVSRVKAAHRKATIISKTYEDVLKDMEDPAMKNFKTIIIDTGGSFVTYLQDWAMRTNPAQNRQKNGALSLKGFGEVKQEFVRFTSYVRDVMQKNIIHVFHSDEQKDKDGNPIQRLLCEGAVRNIVWQPCDFGGYMQMIGNRRVISFTPETEFFAKGCYGIEGQREVPTLRPTDKNDFLTRLFDEARANIEADNAAFAPVREQYAETMKSVNGAMEAITDAKSATDAAAWLATLPNVLTSKEEARALLKEKTAALNLKWSKQENAYVPAEAETAQEA
nr:MAG TPA: AAA domain protein [Caudoviricetes sp.]